ncbi:Laminin-like protein epi-1 [Phytophthora ramorum]|uniref:Laminin-like protein epi-1 n=1 Tax=Phytophthora ramorum TaxID=164328 RepID=UPI00309E4419|nr:Laminin-like protein epi-1 [Phytophthora ramorum]
MEEDRLASSSPRSPKRPRASSPLSSAEKKRRLSPDDGTMRDDTLRIVAEALRSENRQLLQDRDVLKAEKRALDERLAQAQRSLRVLEDDMGRVYRQKQKDMETQRQEFEQKLQSQNTILGRPAGREGSKGIHTSVLQDKRTTEEMDRFLQSCELWQTRLGQLSGQLADRVDRMETQEVSGVLQDVVARVEVDTLQKQVKAQQDQLLLAVCLEADAASCSQDGARRRQDTEVFEAVERQLMDDRVVELETQLAQKRAVEREKEMELSSLRADQEELMHSSLVEPNEEFEAMDVELKQLKEEFERVEEERAGLKRHNLKLLEETRQSREKREANESQVMQQSMAQEAEIKKLKAQLQAAKAREAKMAAVLKGAEKQMEKSKQRKEELNILYAKFSSSMDSVSEKTMRLEELEQEMKDTKSDAQAMQDQKVGLEKQVAQLQEKLDLSAARSLEQENVNDELATVQKQYSELQVVESQQKKLAGKMQSEMTELMAQNRALREQRVQKEHQSVGQPSNEGDKQSSAGADNALVIQTAEKEALRMFVQRYYSAAEDKCWKLLEKVSELEAQKTSAQEQTKESCNVLLMCAQVDTCDEAIRASLLDVVATLEGLT